MVALADIQEYVNEVGQQFRPRQIILFGSYATNSAGIDSDVDLLVVMPHVEKNWKMAAKIRQSVKASFPLDLLVRRPEEMERRIEEGDVLLKSVRESGETLYEAIDE